MPQKNKPGNPEWADWLKERAEELKREKPDDKLAKTFLTAAKSVSLNPVALSHPMDATCLNGIGPYVANWLTKRMEAEYAEQGKPMPQRNMEMAANLAAAKKYTSGKQKLSVKKVKKVTNAGSDGDSDGEPNFAPGEFVGGVSAPRARGGSDQGASSSDDEPRKAPRKAPKASTSKQGGRRLGGGSDDEPAKAPAKRKKDVNTSSPEKPKKKAKAYCPRVQTGAWAILIGLCSFGSGKWKSQDDIVPVADPFFGKAGESLSDKKAGAGGKQQFITGWRSMTKLITEGLVEKKSRAPVLYRITHDGWKIARRACRHAKSKLKDIDEAADLPDFPASSSDEDSEDEAPKASQAKGKGKAKASTSTKPAAKGKAKAREVESSDDEQVRRASSKQSSVAPGVAARSRDRSNSRDWLTASDAPFLFCYLAEGDRRVSKVEEAEVQMDESFTSLYLIEFLPAQVGKHPIFKSGGVWGEHVPVHRESTGPEGKTLSAYLRARLAPPKCSGFDALMPAAGAARSRDSEKENTATPGKRPGSTQSAALQPAQKKSKTNPAAAKAKNTEPIELDSSDEGESALADPRQAAARAAEKRALAAKPAPKQSASLRRAADDMALLPEAGPSRRTSATFRLPANTTSESAVHLPDLYSIPTTTMAPGSYTVSLVIDSREKPGLNNKRLEKMLTESGISWESRTLAMGDAIWIAKCKTTDREVVLDCCLERKRLDDLVSSIKDGRYTEQKARMQRSGVSRLIYLVENYEKESQYDTYGVAIATIKSSLQVCDGIHVHMARTTADACSHLSRLTRTFAELHKYTTLSILPDDLVKRESYFELITQLRKKRACSSFFPSYAAYSKINTKLHNVHGGWAKMVASINAMSLERAEIFLNRFPAPGVFFADLDEMQGEEARKEGEERQKTKKGQGTDGECWVMRQTVKSDQEGATVRPIKQALSTHVWHLFTDKAYSKKGAANIVAAED